MKLFRLLIFTVLLVLFSSNAFAQRINSVIEVAKKWDTISIGPDTDLFVNDLKVKQGAGPVKHTIQISTPTNAIFNIQLKYKDITSVHTLNNGFVVPNNNGHHFSFILHEGFSYNVQHKGPGSINPKIVITETTNVEL